MEKTTKRNRWILQAILLSAGAAMALGGCGGGGGGGSSGSPSPDNGDDPEDIQTRDGWLFFEGNALSAIGPDEPNNVIIVDDQAATTLDNNTHAAPLSLIGGTWEGHDEGLLNSRVSHIAYWATTGELFRVDADLDTDPSAGGRQQMSSEDIVSPDVICNWMPGADFADAEASMVLYKTGDSATTCMQPDNPSQGDDWKGTPLNADANETPLDFPGDPVTPIHNEDGSLAGFLAVDMNDEELVYLDRDFQQQGSALASIGQHAALHGLTVFAGRPAPVIVDSELCIYQHDEGSAPGSLECTGHTFVDHEETHTGNHSPSEHARDGDILYFIDDKELWRVDLAADNPDVDSLLAPDDIPDPVHMAGDLYRVTATPDHVVWIFPIDTTSSLGADETRVVSLERGNYGTMAVDHTYVNTLRSMTENAMHLRRAGEWIFYTGPGYLEATARKADGTGVRTFDDAMWLGASYNPLATNAEDDLDQVFLLEGVQGATEHADTTLKAFSPNDPAEASAVELGTFDSDVNQASFWPLGTGSQRLLRVTSGDISAPDHDVYFIDPETAGSLTQVDGDEDHQPVMGH